MPKENLTFSLQKMLYLKFLFHLCKFFGQLSARDRVGEQSVGISSCVAED